MPRRSTPLYEFMSRSSRAASRAPDAPPRARPEPPEDEENAAPVAPLGGGRSIRVPLGYMFLASAGCMLLLIVAYTIGHSRGEREANVRLDDALLPASVAQSPERISDPLADPSASSGGLIPRGLTPSARGPETPDEQYGPIEFDPRSDEGLNYFVLATTKREGAIRLAEFCRANGLAAYVIDGNNDRFRRVIALPGLRTRSSPQVEALREQIRRIGQAWKARHPGEGESDLSDAYMIQ
jgi:hypothetical protein